MTLTVRNLDPKLQFVSDSESVAAIQNTLGNEARAYDAFFVDTADGEYTEVWGICGMIPYLSKLTTRLL